MTEQQQDVESMNEGPLIHFCNAESIRSVSDFFKVELGEFHIFWFFQLSHLCLVLQNFLCYLPL